MVNKKHFIFPPGIISLLLLPILGIWQLNEFHVFDKFGLIEANYFFDDEPTCINLKSHPEINYTSFHFNGDKSADRRNLDLAQLEIRRLTQSKSLKNGICFHFGDSSKLWALVKAFELCKLEKAENYIGEGNKIWVFNTNPENNQFQTDVLNSYELLCCDCYKILQNENETQFNHYKNIFSLFVVSFILYLILVVLTILKIRTFNRN